MRFMFDLNNKVPTEVPPPSLSIRRDLVKGIGKGLMLILDDINKIELEMDVLHKHLKNFTDFQKEAKQKRECAHDMKLIMHYVSCYTKRNANWF